MKRPRPGRTDPGAAKSPEPVVLVSEPEPEEEIKVSVGMRKSMGPPVFPEEHEEEKADAQASDEPAEDKPEPEEKRCSYCGRMRPANDFYSATMCFSCRAQ